MNVSPGGFIYIKIKQKFQDSVFWDENNENLIRQLCFNIQSPKSTEDHNVISEQFKHIGEILIDKHIAKKEDLQFLIDEINSYKKNSLIMKYYEKNKALNPATVDKYVHMHGDVEGLFGINESLTINQIRELATESFNAIGKVKFFVPKTDRVTGQIIVEKFTGLQNITIASIYSKKNIDRVVLFDEVTPKGWTLIKDISVRFFIYQFIANNGEDIILMSNKTLDQGRYNVTGIGISIRDTLFIGETGKLNSRKKVFLVNTADSVITKYKSVEQYRKALVLYNVSRKNYLNYLFLTKEKNPVVLNHPYWFKRFVWAWFLHAPIGRGNKYPFHVLMVAIKNSGKSWLIDGLYNKSLESQEVFSGTGGSIKGLVPSFATRGKPKIGYLARCHRFAFCDELLKIFRDYGSHDVVEDVSQLNDMLEHKRRAITTGNGSVEINFSARVFAAGNPIKGMKMENMTDLLNRFDESFISRWLVYFQDKEHIRLIRDSDDDDLMPFEGNVNNDEFIGMVDFLHSFRARFDSKRVSVIYSKFKGLFNPRLADYYDSRCKHHIKALMDGIVKTRCFFSHDVLFKAIDDDYDMLDKVWGRVVRSWISSADLKFIPVKNRLAYMPEDVQGVYRFLKPFGSFGLSVLSSVPGVDKRKARECLFILVDNGLISDAGDKYVVVDVDQEVLK